MEKKSEGAPTRSEVGKDFSLKVIETLEALQLLRDAINAVRDGKIYHLAVLSGQMRSLLIDKSKRSERRLLHVAEKLSIPLTVFCMNGVDDPTFPLSEKPMFWVSGFPISTERQLEAQKEMTLESVLGEPFILYQGVQYTPTTIIEWFANKAGGSHYSVSMPKHFVEMLTLRIGSLDPLRNMLLQLAEATLAAGLKFIRAAVQQEVHLLIGVPSRPKSEVYLVDVAYPGSLMRFSLMLDNSGTPTVRLIGLDGALMTLVGNKFLASDRLSHLHLSITVNDELHTRAELYLNGDSLGWVEQGAPLFLESLSRNYDVFHNKAITGEPQDFSFALGELIVVDAKLSPSDRAQIMVYQEQKRNDPQTKLIVYETRSFARSAPGSGDLQMEGTVKRVSAQEILPIGS